MKITWYGTASLSVETKEAKILFDPFVPWKGSPAPTVLDDYDGFRTIFVTHGHFDHIESLPEIIKRNPESVIICTKTPCRTLRKKGVPDRNLKKIAPGKQLYKGDIRVRTYAGLHAKLEIDPADRIFDKRLFQYRGNLWHMLTANLSFPENGETLLYELVSEGKKILLLGSMNLDPDVNYPSSCDILALPYAGYLDNYAVAERIIKRLGPETVFLTHFDDTFPPMTRPMDLSRIAAFPSCRVIIPDYKTPFEF